MDDNDRPGLDAAAPFLIAAAAGLTAALVARSARASERRHPAAGHFIEVDGVTLHYLERGSGPPIVLLHGNGVTAEDWECSGILDGLAAHHRVLAFDRPGFGYSTRPRGHRWMPFEQARVLRAAFAELDAPAPLIVAHSWATLVAVALALQTPPAASGLVLLSGYYFPSFRLDSLLLGGPAVPVAGDLARYTIAPMLARLMSPALVRALFAPAPVDARFGRFPLSLARRPGQLRAAAQEALTMVPAAFEGQRRYADISVPVTVIAGDGDRVADPLAQSDRFARLVSGRSATFVPGAGHMVHYTATARILDEIGRAAERTLQRG